MQKGGFNHFIILIILIVATANLPPQPPIITTELHNRTVHVGESLVLKCEAISGSTPFWQWVRFTTSRPEDQEILQASGFNVSEPNVLTINDVQLSDSGRYICVVDNTRGRRFREAWIEVVPIDTKGWLTDVI